ncbi:MAG TPA: twin-arginine translocase TatA/TatE family subunit [Ornithinimicrobium sp.]|uniref:twin-arginine translocase TatA/TatE family subunit n=1 Tax=Ornithinimicrobium sp. TaxID=1977084 RepID=UPI002B4A7C9A|nr:twin-arginine translocase TatA/TatE family subunit [Ornithinimicrobium sp.]HKJ11292.1 twin-arginine translocase TatA/TatE family subunit [Ornithinimicrobium sp.]
MLNLGAGEVLLILILAFVILGPSKLPEYAAGLARAVRHLRDLAEGAKSQIREEMGPAFDDVNWQQLDPRQYDPRRIVREALAAPSRAGESAATRAGTADEPDPASRAERTPRRRRDRHDPNVPTPFDTEAT